MHPILASDLTNLNELLEQTRSLAGEAFAGLGTRQVAVPPTPVAAGPLPIQGTGLKGALSQFAERWEPGLTAAAGPRYLGFVTGGATPASVAGDWLISTYDQNVSSSDSAAPDLEREVVGWLGELFGLGADHTGSFVSGATMSNFVGLAVAREWLGKCRGVSVARSGVNALGPVDVLSATPHSSIYKALSMLGIGRDGVRTIPTLPGREAIDVPQLANELEAMGGSPVIVVANAGTVNTVDFDDLRAIAALKERYPFWLHVDAAFGGFAALSPQYAHLVDGLDEADSVCVDLHKWLNVPYDSAVQFTRRRDLQVSVFQNSAAYLGTPAESPDFVHLTPENSRRWRALAAWFSLTAYGRDGHREIVERNIVLAQRLGERLSGVPHLRLLAPVRLNVVCFTLSGGPTMTRVKAFAARLAVTGETFVTPTEYDGTPGLRAAFSNWRTEEADVDRIVEALIAAQ